VRILEVPAEELDPFERHEGGHIDREDTPLQTDAFARDLGPSARCGSEVHDDIAFMKQTITKVHLGELDRRATPVRLLLRGSIESVVAAGLEPGLAHGANEHGGPP